MKYIIRKSGIKDISKLVQRKITNKKGILQTVWIRPDKDQPKRLRLLGLGFNVKKFQKELDTTGRLPLLGRTINSPIELAALAKVYRNPHYETFRIIMMNEENKVLGITSISSHQPNTAYAFATQHTSDMSYGMETLRRRMEDLGATKYYLLHNHPSGDSRPSNPDVVVTNFYKEKLKGFQGHLITNHKTHSLFDVHWGGNRFDPKLEPWVTSVTTDSYTEEDALHTPIKPHKALGMTIMNKDDIVSVAESTKFDKKNCALGIVMQGSKVSALLEIPKSYFDKDISKSYKFLQNLQLVGGGELFVVTDKETIISDNFLKLYNKGLMLDVVSNDGEQISKILYDYDWNQKNLYTNPVKEPFPKGVAVKWEGSGKSAYKKFNV